MTTIVETLVEKVIHIKPRTQDDETFSVEQIKALLTINERAHVIAENVRQKGTKITSDDDDPWTWGFETFGGKVAVLQQSENGPHKADVLDINMLELPSNTTRIHVRYSLTDNRILTYEVMDQKGTPTTAYYEKGLPRIPSGLSLRDITGQIGELFQSVEAALPTITSVVPRLPSGEKLFPLLPRWQLDDALNYPQTIDVPEEGWSEVSSRL